MRSLLHELDALPLGLLQHEANELHVLLGGPTLIHLAGKQNPPLFISILMHGNETTGWDAVRALLKRYETDDGFDLPRSLSLFIANTAAAEQGVRRLSNQPDYNRVWPGGDDFHSAEALTMHQVIESMTMKEIFAAIDVHNNTGKNPHYACVNVLENESLQLAALFSSTALYFVRPKGVASMAMAALGASVTLECGKAGEQAVLKHTVNYLDECLNMDVLPQKMIAEEDINLFHTVAIVRIPEAVDFGFSDHARDLVFSDDIEKLNFRELEAGYPLAKVSARESLPLMVQGEDDREVGDRYFEIESGVLRTKVSLMPSMFTRNEAVIKQDCLCYLMERYNDYLR